MPKLQRALKGYPSPPVLGSRQSFDTNVCSDMVTVTYAEKTLNSIRGLDIRGVGYMPHDLRDFGY
jgi:hypothetical protein